MTVLVLSTSLVLVGCSPSETQSESSPAATTHASQGAIDLARLAELNDDFPPGLKPEPTSGPSKVRAEYAHQVGDKVSYGKPFSVDPPECRALFNPVDAREGADRMGIGAGGPQPPALVVSAVNPVAVPVPLPSTGCDRMTFEVEGAIPDGTAERLTAPDIDGAVTDGLKIIYDGGVEYFYTAVLDGRTYVEVMARMAPDFQAEPTLPDLLSKAVSAIRG